VLAVAGLAAVGLVALAGPASADPVGCGGVVTASVVLQQDLTCTGTGLTIGASNITIDLNGHTLTGTATGTHFGSPGITFAFVPGGSPYVGVTIKDGTIQGFDVGIRGSGGSATSYSRLRLVNNGTGLQYDHSAPSPDSLRSSLISGNAIGIELAAFNGPQRLAASHDEIADNGVGIYSTQVNASTLSHNDIHDNGTGVRLFQSDGWVVEHNSIHDNDVGVLLTESTGTAISKNTISQNRIGVRFELQFRSAGTANSVVDNVFESNGAAGVLAQAGPGGVSGVISGNTFTKNGFAPAGTTDAAGQAVDDGLHVSTAGGGSASLLTVTGNKATGNADYGIEAPGVQDGGRNAASGNGNPAQCIGVSCRVHGRG